MSLQNSAIVKVLANPDSLQDPTILTPFTDTIALLFKELDAQGEFEIGDDLQSNLDVLNDAFTEWAESRGDVKEIPEIEVEDEPLETDD